MVRNPKESEDKIVDFGGISVGQLTYDKVCTFSTPHSVYGLDIV